MKNREKHAQEIIDICATGHSMAIETRSGKIVACANIDCRDCNFSSKRTLISCDDSIKEWLNAEYNPQILDEVEKQYLRAWIRPFKHRVAYILKITNGPCAEQIKICIRGLSNGIGASVHVIELPPFKKGTMYKGLETSRIYYPKHLGL